MCTELNKSSISTCHIYRPFVPIFTDFYKQLVQIDYSLATTIIPIDEALKIALEEVLHYYVYRPFSSGWENWRIELNFYFNLILVAFFASESAM